MDDDLGRHIDSFFGFADTPVHQRIRRLKAHLFRVGAGDEGFKLSNRTWCQVPQAKLSQLDSRLSLGQGLWTRPAVVPTFWPFIAYLVQSAPARLCPMQRRG